MNALFNQEAKCRMCDSAKSSNPRPQGQGVTIWLELQTRVQFRVPPPFTKNPTLIGWGFLRVSPVLARFPDMASRAPHLQTLCFHPHRRLSVFRFFLVTRAFLR